MTKLQKIREAAGLSQTRLGALAMIHPGAISKIEHRRQPCWPALRRRICEVLRVPESELFDPEGWAIEVRSNAKRNPR
ncbi:MAG: helix-turn-helix transcriptional regulator [Thermoanaerobacter sp.]|nr:helix-turn-helix transcriptional regulator [Thermoanaerobacter sp.]